MKNSHGGDYPTNSQVMTVPRNTIYSTEAILYPLESLNNKKFFCCYVIFKITIRFMGAIHVYVIQKIVGTVFAKLCSLVIQTIRIDILDHG